MGAYLSKPVTDKISSDGESDRVRYGASSMQGWRVSQEDAHNCILDYDRSTSMFAVYDGHGGHEVALYSSQKLPDYIKETEAYRSGDLNNALIDAFLGFDRTIATKEVITVLKDLANDKNDESNECNSEDEENVNHLCEEASMPIEQVMEKYKANLLNPNLKKLQGEKLPVSPFLRARRLGGECSGPESSAGSSKLDDKFEVKPDKSEAKSEDSEAKPEDSEAKPEYSEVKLEGSDVKPESSEVKSESNEVSSTESEAARPDSVSTTTNGKATIKIHVEAPDSSADCKDVKSSDDVKVEKVNGEVSPSGTDKADMCSSTTPLENGEFTPPGKGKGKAIVKKKPVDEVEKSPKVLPARKARQLYSKLLEFDEEESDSEDENDATFDGGAHNSSSEEEGAEASSEEGEDDEDDEDDDEEEEVISSMYRDEEDQEPGSDSGCTAVVALLHGNELYVANAGDSRCVVCRDGKAVEMSMDHKPEDEPEMLRVQKAGGKVTNDGRVDGGLNLSRAIGDHAYKQNKELSDREQMITALPDVRTITINPAEDEFMVLACDGIWNFMSSQEVVEFVRPRLREGCEKLSQICEEMFDHCLAPNTMGDGTGCDNMTAIIVQFKDVKPIVEGSDATDSACGAAPKRSASPDSQHQENAKRVKTDTEV